MLDFEGALACFTENMQVCGAAGPGATDEEKEKFNLYQGLAAMADGLRGLDVRLRRIEEALGRLGR